MDAEKFIEIYNESRNGCNGFIRHPLVRSFAITDGVRDLADTGCWWLVDILATELPAEFRKNADVSNNCVVTIKVKASKADISAEFDDGIVAWKKHIGWTDLPSGLWKFFVADELEGDSRYRLILLSEY